MLTHLAISPRALLLDPETRLTLEQLHARILHRRVVVAFVLEQDPTVPLNAARLDLVRDITAATREAEQALERLTTFRAPAA